MAIYKNVLRTVIFDMITTAGAPDTSGTPTTTVSKDGGAFAASTNTAARIGATNVFSLVLTATEMNADAVTLVATATGDVPRTVTLYTEADWSSAKAAFVDASIASRSTYSGSDTSGTTTLLTRLPGAITLAAGAVTVGTNNDKTGYTASTVTDKTGYSLTQSFPTNFSATAITAGGAVTVGTNNDKAGYTASTVSDKTGYSIAQTFPTNFSAMAITAGGKVAQDLTQAIPTSNTAQTIGDAYNAARAQGFGKWVLTGTSLAIYAGDGTTIVRTFTLDSATNPTQRT